MDSEIINFMTCEFHVNHKEKLVWATGSRFPRQQEGALFIYKHQVLQLQSPAVPREPLVRGSRESAPPPGDAAPRQS